MLSHFTEVIPTTRIILREVTMDGATQNVAVSLSPITLVHEVRVISAPVGATCRHGGTTEDAIPIAANQARSGAFDSLHLSSTAAGLIKLEIHGR